MKKKAIFMVIVMVMCLMAAACGRTAASLYEPWPSSGITEKIPQPTDGMFVIYNDSSSSFRSDVYVKYAEDQCKSYISACKEMGYTIDGEDSRDGYEAYNSDGYKLRVRCYSSYAEDYSIELEAPMEMSDIKWPVSELANTIPATDSLYGKISTDRAEYFSAYIGKTTKDQYSAYVDKCSAAGYNVGYDRGDKYYHANDNNGNKLSLNYQGGNIIYISIEVPKEETSAEPKKSEEPASSAEPAAPASSAEPAPAPAQPEPAPAPEPEPEPQKVRDDAIRPDVKEAIDSYEKYIDDYCEFMKRADYGDMKWLSDYAKWMADLSDMQKKFDAIQDKDLTTAENNYYLEVLLRCNNKLAQTASSM